MDSLIITPEITPHDIELILNGFGPIGDNNTFLTVDSQTFPLFVQAFKHKSSVVDELDSNEVLEFLGDSFIGAIVAEYLVERFPTEKEGFLTKLRTRLVRTSALAHVANLLGLGRFIQYSQQFRSLNQHMLEDCFEAFVGAIKLNYRENDKGFVYAKRFVVNVIENNDIYFYNLIMNNDNYKDTLQRFFQSKKWNVPHYVSFECEKPRFIRTVFITRDQFETIPHEIQLSITSHRQMLLNNFLKINNEIQTYENENKSILLGIGCAQKKTVAEQQASSIALITLDIHQNAEFQ